MECHLIVLYLFKTITQMDHVPTPLDHNVKPDTPFRVRSERKLLILEMESETDQSNFESQLVRVLRVSKSEGKKTPSQPFLEV